MKKFILILTFIFLGLISFSQSVLQSPLCYGEPIRLFCNYPDGCSNPGATFHWENFSGSWSCDDRDIILWPPGTKYPRLPYDPLDVSTWPGTGQTYSQPDSLCYGEGYATDKFYLSLQFAPPPGGFYGGRVTIMLVKAVPTAVITSTPCVDNNGAIDLSVTGGKVPYSYLWSNGATTQDISLLYPATYTVTVTEGNGCKFPKSCIVGGSFTISETIIASRCGMPKSGQINLDVNCSPPNTYTYLWSDGNTNTIRYGLEAGTYTVTVTNQASFSLSKSYTIY